MFNTGFVIFPNLTQLDFTGPLQVMSFIPNATMHIVAKSKVAVPSDCGLDLVPTVTFKDCPQLDLICVPGGAGVPDALLDAETIAFIQMQGQGARYVTSVCTGAFLLGAAGLLQGRKATTHWGYTELLSIVGATYENQRVVQDGNVITAGGVTSGIDFGFTILAELGGNELAEAAQLSIEYDPAPPFQSGRPEQASKIVKERVFPRYERARALYRERLEQLS